MRLYISANGQSGHDVADHIGRLRLYRLVGCTAGFEKYPESEAEMFQTADAAQ